MCTTFTSMHPEEWNPAWTVETILTGFLSFMTGEERGSGCLQGVTNEVRVKLAKESKRWNSLECQFFRENFSELHRLNVLNETFTEEEKEKLKKFDKDIKEEGEGCNKNDGDAGETKLLDTSYESHTKEDWEKFGSMEEEDFDYYDGEEEEEEIEGEGYDTSDTEMD